MSGEDRNLIVETKINRPGIRFYNVLEEPFGIYGVYFEEGKFRRMPESVAKTVNAGVLKNHSHTAGGRIRFRTDSPYVAVSARVGNITRFAHFSVLGYCGMDLYIEEENRFIKSFVPPAGVTDYYEGVIDLPGQGMRTILIHMPTYADVESLHIGLAPDAKIAPPEPYKNDLPVVYYGSSITQGGCVSRPGNIYQAIISRRFQMDYVNLGFSGHALAEETMVEYIRRLPMTLFVMDYDHNAPNPQYLEQTHGRMFRKIREANPELPIVLMTAPRFLAGESMLTRRAIIRRTYQQALAAGDRNVYLLEGPELMALAGNEGTVDNVHPNDLGFMSMAKALGDLMERECLLPVRG